MPSNKIDTLIVKYIFRQLNSEEFKEIEEWIDHSAANKSIFNKIVSLHQIQEQIDLLHQHDKEESWEKIVKNIRRHRIVRRIAIYSSAAVIAVVLGLAGITYLFQPSEQSKIEKMSIAELCNHSKIDTKATMYLSDNSEVLLEYNYRTFDGVVVKDGSVTLPQETRDTTSTVKRPVLKPCNTALQVPRGSEYAIVLSDGTKVKMNSDSHLNFPEQFGVVREVNLEGEAYFDVTHDAARPFIVKTATSTIRVLGTKFNVSAYPKEPVIVTLLEGKVEVSSPTGKYILTPNKQYTSAEANVKTVDAAMSASWVNGTMEFDALPMSELAAHLSRWYNVDIQLGSKELYNMKFTGIIFRDKPLNFAFDIIHRVSDVNFVKRGAVIYVIKKK